MLLKNLETIKEVVMAAVIENKYAALSFAAKELRGPIKN